jgi:hypothetical protein
MHNPSPNLAAGQAASECYQNVLRTLQTITRSDQVFEIRILGVEGSNSKFKDTASGYFDHDHLEEAARLASQWSMKAEGTYFTMNPVEPGLLARADNRIILKPKHTTGDTEIIRRLMLIFDLDPRRPAGISSTDEELAYARGRLEHLMEQLSRRNWPEPIVAGSGNGYHGGYRIDLPVDDGGLVERVLKAADQLWSDERVTIDPALFNPSRIIKLWGTIVRKGCSIPSRPHRYSGLISVPEILDVVPLHLLEDLASEYREPAKAETRFGGGWPTLPKPARSGEGVHYPKPGKTVFDDFNGRVSWDELLADWRPCSSGHGSEIRLTRPGKEGGVSATIGHEGRDVLHIFTSSASPFTVGQTLNKFQTFALLQHGGSIAAAAEDLSEQGFGTYIDHDGSEVQNPPPRDWATRGRKAVPQAPAVPAVHSNGGKVSGNGNGKAQPNGHGDAIEFGKLSPKELGLVLASDVELANVDWLWKYHLARGEMALLAGEGGLGKSTFLLACAMALSTGGLWPDRGGHAPLGHTVIVSAEDSPETTLGPRLIALGADLKKITFCKARLIIERNGHPSVSPMCLRDHEYWKAVLRTHADTALLIIDPIPSYLGRGVNDRQNCEIREVLEPFIEDVLRPLRVCMWGNTHLNKTLDVKSPVQRITGSAAYGNIPRNVHLIAKDTLRPDRRYFKQAKCNNGPADLPAIGFRIEQREIEFKGQQIETATPIFDEKVHANVDMNELLAGDKGRRGPKPVKSSRFAEWLWEQLGADKEAGKQVQVKALIDRAIECGLLKAGADGKAVSTTLIYRAKDRIPEDHSGWRVVEQKLAVDVHGEERDRVHWWLTQESEDEDEDAAPF